MRASSLLAFLLALLPVGATALTVEEWRIDLAYLVDLIEVQHPDPFTRISREAFLEQVQDLEDTLAARSDTEVAAAMMHLVGSIRDGHTTLHPKGRVEFRRWLPLSFYQFEDGLFIVAAHKDHQQLIGRRLLRVEDTPVDQVLPKIKALMGSDNAAGNDQNIFYLGSVDALHALGFASSNEAVVLTTSDSAGRAEKVPVPVVEGEFVLDESRFWGEMYAPVPTAVLSEFVMLDGISLRAFARSTPEEMASLPLHLRHRRAYWATHLPEQSVYYMQINHTTSGARGPYESFEQFYESAFEFLEKNPVDKFVLDLRYNSGGDGSIVTPFVHKFIRDDKVNRPGHLFTITGRKTYSAATMLVDLMLKHTNTLLVGEPLGSALNGYGDPRSYVLPSSGMSLDLSSEFWKLVHSSKSPRMTPIDIPVGFLSTDYFAREDPAMTAILAIDAPYLSLTEVLVADGGTAAQARYEHDKARFGRYPWWRSFDESTFRKAARALTDAEHFADGVPAFEILVDAYPGSWRAWRDFAKARLAQGETALARACLMRAQRINPGDPEINELLSSVGGG